MEKEITNHPLEFKINEYLTLKLENRKTNIFVNDKIFKHCKFLLLDIPINEVNQLNEIESIDEAEERLDRSLESIGRSRRNTDIIPPETEFWAHCSNLQVWYENDYDTRLLHRNLAFSLLAKLANAGDPTAKKVFNEEIVKRFLSGHFVVMEYLFELKYLRNLGNEEYEYMLEQLEDRGFNNYMTYENRIIGLNDPKDKILDISPTRLNDFPSLTNIQINNILKIKNLEKFTGIEILDIGGHKITEIKGLGNLKKLKKLVLWDNQISEIKGLDDLENLEELRLAINNISEIKGLDNLKNLRKLWLYNNKISEIKSLENLKNLTELNLSGNYIRKIEGLDSLVNLKRLKLNFNEIKEVLPKFKEIKELLHYIHNILRKGLMAQLQRNFGLILVQKRDKKITTSEELAEEEADRYLYEWNPKFLERKYRVPHYREKLEKEIAKSKQKLKKILKNKTYTKSEAKKKFEGVKKKIQMELEKKLLKPKEWLGKIKARFNKKLEIIRPYYDYLDTAERKIVEYLEERLNSYTKELEIIEEKLKFKIK